MHDSTLEQLLTLHQTLTERSYSAAYHVLVAAYRHAAHFEDVEHLVEIAILAEHQSAWIAEHVSRSEFKSEGARDQLTLSYRRLAHLARASMRLYMPRKSYLSQR